MSIKVVSQVMTENGVVALSELSEAERIAEMTKVAQKFADYEMQQLAIAEREEEEKLAKQEREEKLRLVAAIMNDESFF